MKTRLTTSLVAVSMLAIGSAYAGGAGGCEYHKGHYETYLDTQDYPSAVRKLVKADDTTSSAAETSAATPAKAGDAASGTTGTPK